MAPIKCFDGLALTAFFPWCGSYDVAPMRCLLPNAFYFVATAEWLSQCDYRKVAPGSVAPGSVAPGSVAPGCVALTS